MYGWMSAAVVLAILRASSSYSYTGERSIRTSVLSSFAYDRMARPATTVYVGVSMTLITVVDLDTDLQELTCTGWFTLQWEDERLVWRPSNYDDTDQIHAVQGEVWKPEMLIDNSMNDVGIIGDDDLNFQIQYTGSVYWEPATLFEVHCAVNMTYFPFDEHTCIIELRSWGLTKEQLVLTSLQDDITISDYRENALWELTNTTVASREKNITFNNDLKTYSELTFTLKLRRRTSYYHIHTFVPIVTTSILVTLVFLVPPESGEKMTFSLTIFLCIVVLDTIYLPQIPDSTAYLALYLAVELCFAATSTILAALVLALHHRSECSRMWTVHAVILTLLEYLTLWTHPVAPPPDEVPDDDSDEMSAIDLPTDNLKKVQRRTWSLRNNSIRPELEEGFTEHELYRKPKSAKSAGIDFRILSGTLRGLKPRSNFSDEPRKRVCKLKFTWKHAAMLYDRVLFVTSLSLTFAYNWMFLRIITQGLTDEIPNA